MCPAICNAGSYLWVLLVCTALWQAQHRGLSPHAMDSGPTSSLTETDQRCHPSSPEITTHKLHPLQNTISPWTGGKIGNVLALTHFLIISPILDKTTKRSMRVALLLFTFVIVLIFFSCRGMVKCSILLTSHNDKGNLRALKENLKVLLLKLQGMLRS